ncbi:MAG: 6-pyruvoyl tetrahydropterin synthase [Rhodospirillaceae bacterium BRH_c57]|nr:MAG: 6-pyruvoyl tetrahydropterin synthase [Rhodospirillaceae bacterium BRH_c57]
MSSHYVVTRRIGIDAGHRIRLHGSKCRHVHGHRYEVEATCRADHLHREGEQTGMVLDFGFLKEEMLRVIDAPCDHGFIAELADEGVLEMFSPPEMAFGDWLTDIQAAVAADGFAAVTDCRLDSKLYVVPFPPTAEALARHWFERLAPLVRQRSDGVGDLMRLRVWETPNCWAEWGV